MATSRPPAAGDDLGAIDVSAADEKAQSVEAQANDKGGRDARLCASTLT